MKNFQLIAKELPVEPLLEEIDRLPEVWDLQTGRQNVMVQREARAISIRGLKKSKIRGRQRRDVHESRYTTISRQFPATTRFICSWANAFDSELARAKLVNLPPGHVVYPHRDRGAYYQRRNRYHFVLQSEGSVMRCGGEEIRMLPAELWWFDNKEVHEARNDGAKERIHLIFDLEPRNGLRRPTAHVETKK